MIRTLADLVAPADEAFFIRNFSMKQQFLLRTDKPGRAETLLPWKEIDRLFANSTRPPDRFKIVLNGNRVEPRMFCDGDTGVLRTDALLRLAWQGATFVISGISHHVPAVDALTAAIERRLGCRVWANCYASFGKWSGFVPHADPHDVMILQVWGSKRWRTYGMPVPHLIDDMRPAKPEIPIWEDVLHSGDVLYVPRGEFHDAVPEERPSVHLTIGLLPSRGMNFMQWLGARAGTIPSLRADLERPFVSPESVQNDVDIKQRLHALIDETSIGDYLATEDRTRPIRRVAAFAISTRLTAASILVTALRRRLDLETEADDEREIEIAGEPVRLSALARRVLHAITMHDRMAVADIAAALDRRPDDQALLDGLDELARRALISIED